MIILIPAYEPDSRSSTLRQRRCAQPTRRCASSSSTTAAAPPYAAVFDRRRRRRCRACIGYDDQPRQGRRAQDRLRCTSSSATRRGRRLRRLRRAAHACADILRVADRLRATDARGRPRRPAVHRATCRAQPLRQRGLARAVPARRPGVAVHDTQTGLRGYPAELLPWLPEVPGRPVRVRAQRAARAAAETASAHRRDRDRDRLPRGQRVVALPPDRRLGAGDGAARQVVAASLGSFVLDTVVLQLLFIAERVAVLVGRRRTNGQRDGELRPQPAAGVPGTRRPAALDPALRRAGADPARLELRLAARPHRLRGALLPAKIATELVLYVIGFQVQRGYVFARGAREQRLTARRAGETPARLV